MSVTAARIKQQQQNNSNLVVEPSPSQVFPFESFTIIQSSDVRADPQDLSRLF